MQTCRKLIEELKFPRDILGVVAVLFLLANGALSFAAQISIPARQSPAPPGAAARSKRNAVRAHATGSAPAKRMPAERHGVFSDGAGGTQLFVNRSRFSTGSGNPPAVVSKADFNSDSIEDLAVLSGCELVFPPICSTNAVSIFIGNGDGTFKTPVDYVVGYLQSYASIAVGDFNGDGKPDLVVTGGYGNNGLVQVLLGNGDGTFQPALGSSTGNNVPGPVAIADFNADGRLDIAVAECANIGSCANGSVGILLGNGDGIFSPEVTYGTIDFPSSPGSVAVGDFNAGRKLRCHCFPMHGCNLRRWICGRAVGQWRRNLPGGYRLWNRLEHC